MKKSRILKKRKNKPGAVPGSLVFVGKQKLSKTRIRVIDYDKDTFEKLEFEDINEVFNYKEKSTCTWINIDGLHDTELINKLGQKYGIHSLVLEDILNTDHRPKLEDHDNYFHIILKMPYLSENRKSVVIEQISFIIGKDFIISFQEKVGDIFDPIRSRLENKKGRIRTRKIDYLAYCFIDVIVDNYLLVLENLYDKIEILEDRLINQDPEVTLNEIYELKRSVMFLRKNVIPVRGIIQEMTKGEIELIEDSTVIYLKDIYDHILHVVSLIDTFREMLSEMFNIYMSNISNRMNEIMKTLTVIATIFIPLTFVAGIYGMNFEAMPELHWKYGYVSVWVIIIITALIMLNYFKKKKWF